MTAWTDDRVATLTKLWIAGHSGAQIARALGGGVSRNAVIAKAWRIGLQSPPKPTAPAARPVARSVSTPLVVKPSLPKSGPIGQRVANAVSALVLMSAPELGEALAQAATTPLEDLSANGCRWPIGNPASDSFGFCGQAAPGKSPYCEAHRRAAYKPQAAVPKAKAGNGYLVRWARS